MRKRFAALSAALISVLSLAPVATGANSNPIPVPTISIPFIQGKTSFTELAATVTKTTTGSTVGIPFALAIANPGKLPTKIHISAIGGLNGVSGGPGNQILTYQMIVAIDATGVPPGSSTSGGSTLSFKIAGGSFQTVKPGKYSAPASCGFVGDASKSLIKIGINKLPRLNFEEFGAALKKACPTLKK